MEEKLSCVMDIGEQMLLSGAEVHRVEESITRMCTALGAVRTDIFIITSSMIATVYTCDGNTFTQTRRIASIGTDFEKIHRLNALSRRICGEDISPSQIRLALEQAVACKSYPFWLETGCYGLIAGVFTLFFGGGLQEAFISLLTGLLTRLGTIVIEKGLSNKIFSMFFSTALATALAFFALRLKLIPTVDMIIIGNIMSLIPGIGLTNALRDLFTGDSIAGLLRSIEAVLVALAIAAGYFLVTILGGFMV